MSAPSIVNALVVWATGDRQRIDTIKADRDACVAAVLNGGKSVANLISASLNGKSFSGITTLDLAEKLSLFTSVLIDLGEVVNPLPSGFTGNFSLISR